MRPGPWQRSKLYQQVNPELQMDVFQFSSLVIGLACFEVRQAKDD